MLRSSGGSEKKAGMVQIEVRCGLCKFCRRASIFGVVDVIDGWWESMVLSITSRALLK
jgi:hypothetical protein